jgi:hypothetical protein
VGAAEGAGSRRGDGLALIAAAVATALLFSLSACGGDSGTDIDELRASGAPLYWLGEEFEGLPLVHASDRGFIYGDCDPGPDSGCAPPLQLQHWPLAQRHPSKFRVTPGRRTSCTRGKVGGRTVAAFPTTGGLEVYIGRTVVVVFAEWQRTLRAVKAMRPLAGPGQLPKPPAALRRALARCDVPLRESSETSG